MASLPKITLHQLDRSRAQRIAWLIEELDLEYATVPYKRLAPNNLAPPELEKIHPLGKSPVLTIEDIPGDDAGAKPIVLAESGFMVQYLCEHEKKLVPEKWKPGREGAIGGETEAWMRWMYVLHYVEGSFMPVIVISLIMNRLRGSAVPFFIRPISRTIADRLAQAWLLPNARQHLAFIDSLLATAPSGGPYLCGPEFTAADVMLSFPLLFAPGQFDSQDSSGTYWAGGKGVEKEFARVFEYLGLLKQREAWKRAEERFGEVMGEV